MRLKHFALLMTLSLALMWSLEGTTTAQTTTVETVAFALTDSDLIANSYNPVFGSGNGVYVTAPDGAPPANDVPYYLWPGGAQEALNANADGVINGTAPLGAGAWQPNSLPANDGKIEVLIHPDEIFGNGTYTLSDLNSITWETNKTGAQSDPDWYVNIWLDAGSGNVAFLSGEPYWSNNLNGPANTWNTWTADNVAGGTNEILFHEPGFACTTFGWSSGGAFGPMPRLDELTSGAWTWNNVPSQSFISGCGVTPNPLTTTIDYSTMPILGISIATGNPWAGPFTGFVDNLQILLDDPSTAGNENRLIVDFEPDDPVDDPQIDKIFNPDTITLGEISALEFTISNANASPLGDIEFTDNLPSGMTVATPPNISANSCDGIVTANAGSSTISLIGGVVQGNSSCGFSVDVIATTTGGLNNTTGTVSTTSRDFPIRTNGNTASATLIVNAPQSVSITANDPSAVENTSNDGQFTVTLSSSNTTGSAITVNYNIAGTATNGVDYVTISGSVDILDGEGDATIDIVAIADSLTEGNEAVILTLTSTSSPTILVSDSSAAVVISDEPEENNGDVVTGSSQATPEPTAIVLSEEELNEQVTELPSTGETPYWRNWLIAVIGLGVISMMGMMALFGRKNR